MADRSSTRAPQRRTSGPARRGPRRYGAASLTLAALLAAASAAHAQRPEGSAPEAQRPPAGRAVAITIDDLPVVSTRRDIAVHRAVTSKLLATLVRAGVPAIGFVNEEKLRTEGELDTARVALLRQWVEAGMQLGNHSYSHGDLHRTPLAEYQADVLRGEKVTRPLLEAHGKRLAYFRHPFLHTGRDLETKRAFQAFLAEHGYRIAPVTIDNADYIFARAYDLALDRDDAALKRRVADTYVAYMDTVFGYYAQQSRALLGYELPQVLLLHANRLNADHLDRLLAVLRRREYAFVSLDEALADPAYTRPDAYTGPAGITWLHRWALAEGKRGEFFRGEPEVPAWVAEASEIEGL